MLTAVTSTENQVTLLSPQDYRFMHDYPPPYFCPICRQRVILKKGKVRRWHFAHHVGSVCPSQAEPETEEHMLGKAILYEWLQRQSMLPELEVYFPAIQRQADLLVSISNTYYALEFQCSSISEEEMVSRTNDYLSIGVHPIWIFSLSRLRHKENGLFSVHAFEWSGIRARQSDNRHALLYFLPSPPSFSFLFPRTVISSTQVYADYYVTPAKQLTFSAITQLPSTIDGPALKPEQWLRLKKQWRFGRNNWRERNDKAYMRHIFADLRSDLPYFPAEAGWPHLYMEVFHTPPYVWQSWFLLQFLPSIPIGTSFRAEAVEMSIKELSVGPIFSLRSFPLIDNPLSKAIIHYMFLLEKMNVLKQDGTRWKKSRDVLLPSSVEAGFEADKMWNLRIRY